MTLEPQSMVDVLLRLVAAALCGGVIGMERERQAQPAGLRTHMVLAAGSALLTIVSIQMAGPNNDPARIAAQVVSGIGFLGAGAILRAGLTVRGLTTAACLWTAAGIGLAAGAGYLVEGLLATIVVFLIVWGIDAGERVMGYTKEHRHLHIVAADRKGLDELIRGAFGRQQVAVRRIGVQMDFVGKKVTLSVDASSREGQDWRPLIDELSAVEGVERVALE